MINSNQFCLGVFNAKLLLHFFSVITTTKLYLPDASFDSYAVSFSGNLK